MAPAPRRRPADVRRASHPFVPAYFYHARHCDVSPYYHLCHLRFWRSPVSGPSTCLANKDFEGHVWGVRVLRGAAPQRFNKFIHNTHTYVFEILLASRRKGGRLLSQFPANDSWCRPAVGRLCAFSKECVFGHLVSKKRTWDVWTAGRFSPLPRGGGARGGGRRRKRTCEGPGTESKYKRAQNQT